MKKLLLAAALLLVAGATAACGGGTPTDASEADFCEAALSYDSLLSGEEVTGKGIKDYAEELEDTGGPKDMPDDARDGLDLFIETAKGLDDDATTEDLDALDADFSDDDQKAFEAYSTYLAETCADELQDQLGDLGTELPELPDAS